VEIPEAERDPSIWFLVPRAGDGGEMGAKATQGRRYRIRISEVETTALSYGFSPRGR
jgi:hypothetical protein